MGTRADFYSGKGKKAEWLGSVALDGYPEGISRAVLEATETETYKKAVGEFISSKNHGTIPAQGWPWPWENSKTTDYSYWFFGGKVWASCFGGAFFDPMRPETDPEENDKSLECPDLDVSQSAPAGSRRAGNFVLSING